MSKTLKEHPKVDEVGPDGDDGYFVDLKTGWTCLGEGNERDGCHCFGAATVREALDVLAGAEQCICPTCRS